MHRYLAALTLALLPLRRSTPGVRRSAGTFEPDVGSRFDIPSVRLPTESLKRARSSHSCRRRSSRVAYPIHGLQNIRPLCPGSVGLNLEGAVVWRQTYPESRPHGGGAYMRTQTVTDLRGVIRMGCDNTDRGESATQIKN